MKAVSLITNTDPDGISMFRDLLIWVVICFMLIFIGLVLVEAKEPQNCKVISGEKKNPDIRIISESKPRLSNIRSAIRSDKFLKTLKVQYIHGDRSCAKNKRDIIVNFEKTMDPNREYGGLGTWGDDTHPGEIWLWYKDRVTIKHELGHALSLQHKKGNITLMHPYSPCCNYDHEQIKQMKEFLK